MVILGLGSNIGDRLVHLRSAIILLGQVVQNIRCSSILESAAVVPEGAPKTWDKPYYNMAISGNTTLKVSALLEHIKKVELIVGRKPDKHWAPREIDIDILAMDGVEVKSEVLVVPHPQLFERDFALIPFVELAPDWVFRGKTASQILKDKGYKMGPTLRDTGWHIHV